MEMGKPPLSTFSLLLYLFFFIFFFFFFSSLAIDQPIPFPDTSYDGNFYREITRRLFGNKQVNCFELYTLHIALVPQKYHAFFHPLSHPPLTVHRFFILIIRRQVIVQNRRLVKKLREGRPKPWNIPKFAV